jgi:hypothetical protein
MADIIEEAKSARATCRTCREKIEKGALRFGHETANQFDPGGAPSYMWHHLLCGAKRHPLEVKTALAAFTGNVPNRAEVEAVLSAAPKSAGLDRPPFPYAERASTGRSKCLACQESIDKGTIRIAVEREVDTGMFTQKGAGYLHPRCSVEHLKDPELRPKLRLNSRGFTDADFAELEQGLSAGTAP